MQEFQEHALIHRIVNKIMVLQDFVTLMTLISDFANSVQILVEDAKMLALFHIRGKKNARKFARGMGQDVRTIGENENAEGRTAKDNVTKIW
jgi:hypothetical protein